MMKKIRKDRFLKSRGGTFRLLDIVCVKCNDTVLVYQKDGQGALYRAYLNRILVPEELAELKDRVEQKSDLDNLECRCGQLIGVPMLHQEGRLAFRLVPGSYKKRVRKQ